MSRVVVQVVVGKCPTCGNETKSVETLDGLFCAMGHPQEPYLPHDAYYRVEQAA
jgi:hypothetical protein